MIFYRLFANYTLVCHSTSLCLCSLGCLLKACIFIKWSWLLLSVEAWWISTLLLGGVSLIYFQSTVILGLCSSGPLPGFDPEIRKYVNMYSMPLIETGLIVSRWLESIGKYNYVVWVGYKWIEMRWVNFKICIAGLYLSGTLLTVAGRCVGRRRTTPAYGPVDCLDVSSFFILELPNIDKAKFSTTTWFTVDEKYIKSIIFLYV